jgi:hypothetical protein
MDSDTHIFDLSTTPGAISASTVRDSLVAIESVLRAELFSNDRIGTCVFWIGHHRKYKNYSSTKNAALRLEAVQLESPGSYSATIGLAKEGTRPSVSILVSQIDTKRSPELALQVRLSGWDDEMSDAVSSRLFVEYAQEWRAISGKRVIPSDPDEVREFPIPEGRVSSRTHGIVVDRAAVEAIGGRDLLDERSTALATYDVGGVEYTVASLRREIRSGSLSTWLEPHLADLYRPIPWDGF